MIRQQFRAVTVAAVLVVAAAVLWWGLGSQWASTVESVGHGATPDVAHLHGDVLHPPADLDVARKVAGDFAVALYRDDVDGMRALMTDQLADRLLGNTVGGSAQLRNVTVDGMTTEDLQEDRAVLEVVVRRGAGGDERLDVVRVALLRLDGRWLVNDAAF